MRTGPTAVKHRGLAPEEQPARRTGLLQHPACASTYGRRHEHAHWSSRSDVSEISGIPLPAVISEVVGEQQQLIPQYTAEQDHRCLSVSPSLAPGGHVAHGGTAAAGLMDNSKRVVPPLRHPLLVIAAQDLRRALLLK